MKKLIQISILLSLAPLAFADHDEKGSKDLPPTTSNALVDVIIQFKVVNTKNPGPELQADFNQIQALLKKYGINLVQNNGQQQGQNGQGQGDQHGQHQGEHDDQILHASKAIHVKVPASVIPVLKANPAVKYVSPNRPTTKFLDLTTAAVNANLAWQYGWDGTGVGVAVIDSGVIPKNDLTGTNGTSRIVYSENFATGQADASDAYGHGTHVAGILGSSGKSSTGIIFKRTFKGVAPNVNIINLRVLDANGGGMESDVIAAIQQAINLQSTYNIRVINLSLGRPVFESYTLDPLCQAVEAAWQAGIVVVVAAGNYGRDNSLGNQGYGTISSPGNDPYVITVGAMNTNGTSWTSDDTIASYSSKGPTLADHIVKPDLVAPGNNIISLLVPGSTLATNYPKTLISNSTYETLGLPGVSGDYFRLSGTSMATPVVSGAAALLIQQHPSLTPDQVKARLMKTAAKALNLYSTGIDALTLQAFQEQADIFTVGAGYLDINAALANNDLATLPALSPKAVHNAITKTTVIVRGASWGDSVLWGDSVVYGNVVFKTTVGFSNNLTALDDSVLWGDSVIWGQDDSVLWGDTVNAITSTTALSSGDGDK
jgi:serine protease AprX